MGKRAQRDHITRRRLGGGLAGAVALAITVIASARGDDSGLGAPGIWPWLLTGLQVLALWSAGRRWWWGWLLGGSVQIPWIAYAMLTGQVGFIPGCAISAAVQIVAFLRNSPGITQATRVRGPFQEAAT
jgi:hypothetical protein